MSQASLVVHSGQSPAEDLFIDLFSDAFGPEKTQYLSPQYSFVDIYGKQRYIDFAIESIAKRVHKSEKDFSPTTMYEDYAINETHFHWQSQSTTSPSSTTGQRYINHQKTGNKVLLFIRDFKKEDGQAAPYTYFGKADFVSTTGSKPMNIIWKLQEPMPADYVSKAVQANVG